MSKLVDTKRENVLPVTFPEPVKALPHISRPVNANGMHAAYNIWVSITNRLANTFNADKWIEDTSSRETECHVG